jgi:hypothetical protein
MSDFDSEISSQVRLCVYCRVVAQYARACWNFEYVLLAFRRIVIDILTSMRDGSDFGRSNVRRLPA